MHHPFLDMDLGELSWCLHCEQVQLTSEWAKRRWWCPTPGCDGSALDVHDYLEQRSELPWWGSYPEDPEPGTHIPLYSDGGDAMT
jgi:hypothetical protein